MPTDDTPPDGEGRRVSQREIARRLGVSHVTVSMALRDNSRVSESVRQQVKQLAAELGYRPDPMLAALANYRQGQSGSTIRAAIGWVNAWTDPEKLRSYKEFDCYWNGARKAAGKFGYRLEEFCLHPGISPSRLHQILQARGIKGLLLPPAATAPDWADFPWSEYCIVRFGRSLPAPRSHVVTADQVANTMTAFDRIRALGYRRVGLIAEESRIQRSGHLFEGGYMLAQLAVPEKDRVPVFSYDSSSASSGESIATWIKKHKVDAIFTDVAQVQVLLKRHGIRVPEDIGLAVTTTLDTGVDSGIDQQPEEIGRVGFLMLNSLINDGATGIPSIFRQILVEGSWVDGTSMPGR